MPVIGGRFYANPAFGEALERARREAATEEADRPFGDDHTEAEEQGRRRAARQLGVEEVARIVHNEGAGARPTSRQGAGSDQDLSESRQAMAQMILNQLARGRLERVAPPRLSPSEARAVQSNPLARAHFEDAERAAEQAVRVGGDPEGPMHFFHAPEDWTVGDPRRPAWGRGTPLHRYGPFLNTAGGHVPKGKRFYIEIHP